MRKTLVRLIGTAVILLLSVANLYGWQFTKEEYAARRSKLMEQIPDGIAIILGAQPNAGYNEYYQNNDFMYLSGVEIPNAILVIDGVNKESVLFFTSSESAARNEGISLDFIRKPEEETGIEKVMRAEQLSSYLAETSKRVKCFYTFFNPEELMRECSREKFGILQRNMTNNEWDGRLTRELQFVEKLKEKYPAVEVKDCSSMIWDMRMIKSPAEIELMREAGRIGVKAHLEVMKATKPGVKEYELAALYEYICKKEGAQDLAYYMIVCSGENHAYVHYYKHDRTLADGDFLVIDVGPDFHYYDIDITVSYPVNGKFTPRQREIYEASNAVHEACMKVYRPGITVQQVRAEANAILEKQGYDLSSDLFQRMRPGTGHSVGMAVHDVGSRGDVLKPGMVFANEPYTTFPEENLGVRVEDTILITEDGCENLTAGLPRTVEEIEAFMQTKVWPPKFELIQAELFSARNSMTHAWADFDNDGDLDLFVGFRPDLPNRLYRNDEGRFTDVAPEVGVADLEGTRAVAWGDYNADGRLDLFVGFTAGEREDFAKISNKLYRNDGASFTDVTKEMDLVLPLGQSRQISWIDFDNDEDIDLFVAFRDIPNMLFRNDDGKFSDVAQAMGITGSRATMGGVWFDYDMDGDLDLYLGNMDGYANRMYRNDRTRFVDVAPELGLDSGGRAINANPGDHDMAGTIRPDIADFDNDGDFDIFVTNMGGADGFYQNNNGDFVNIAPKLGLAHGGYRGTAAWADYDNDGWIDLYANGTLYHNEQTLFKPVTPEVIRSNVGGYGSLWGDYDNNGAMDLALSSSNHYIIRNMLPVGSANNCLKVMVLNGKGIHTRAGTEIRLFTAGTKHLLGTRIIETGSGYNAQSVRPVHFGLPNSDPVDLEITLMSRVGRKIVSYASIEPNKYQGSYLKIMVDSDGRIVK